MYVRAIRKKQRQGIIVAMVSCLLLYGIKFALCELGRPPVWRHWGQSLRTQEKGQALTYRGVLSLAGVIYSAQQILLMYLSRVFYRFSDFLLEKGRIKLNPQQLWIFEKAI